MASPAPPADPLVYHAASSDWGARIEPNCVVPEHLALPLAIHLPVQYKRDRLGEVALAVRIIRGIHQHVIADQIDDGVRQPGALWDFDALEVAPASDVLARLVREFRQRCFDRLGMFVKPRHPKRKPAVPSLQSADAQGRVAVHYPTADQRRHVAHATPWVRRRTLQPQIVPGVLSPGA